MATSKQIKLPLWDRWTQYALPFFEASNFVGQTRTQKEWSNLLHAHFKWTTHVCDTLIEAAWEAWVFVEKENVRERWFDGSKGNSPMLVLKDPLRWRPAILRISSEDALDLFTPGKMIAALIPQPPKKDPFADIPDEEEAWIE